MKKTSDSPRRRILMFCQDIPPTWGMATAGGGVRCWGLAQGLASRGHEVLISVPRPNIQDVRGAPADARDISHTPGVLMPVVHDVDPDIVITIQWPLASSLDDMSVPLVIDLYGPLLLENLYFPSVHWESLVARKIRALYLGDFYLCGSQRQLAYFLPWLLQAGVQLDRAPVHIAPLTMPPGIGKGRPCAPGEPHFVAAGIFWPWQNPAPALMTLLEALDGVGKGRLTIVGGPHPQWKQGVFPGEAPAWPKELLRHPRVTYRDLMSWDDLNALLDGAHVGVDLSLPNIERFLAAPTRVYHYLWRGIPVLLSGYLELAPVITNAGAGWAVDPTDPADVRRAVLSIVEGLEAWEHLSANATTLVDGWEAQPTALYEFCRNPSTRPRSPSLEQQMVMELVKVYRGLGNAEAELEHLRKDVSDRDLWLAETNRRVQQAEERLAETDHKTRALAVQLAAAEDRLARVRRTVPYRIYRSVQVLFQGPDEVRRDRTSCKRPLRLWILLLRFTAVGGYKLAAQGVWKWKNALGNRARMLRA